MTRDAFTLSELRFARKLLQSLQADEDRTGLFPLWSRVRSILRRDKVQYKLVRGMYRTVFMLPRVVIKVFSDDWENTQSSSLQKEAEFVRRYQRTKYRIHFPTTRYFGGKSSGFQFQRRVLRKKLGLYDEVLGLAEFLGVEDCHSNNFGWAGRKGQEYPIFYDLEEHDRYKLKRDFRSSKPRRRFWMV